MTDPAPGGTTVKLERVLSPFQQLIALGVALIFERDIP
jgi:hypothetical protein